MILDERNEFADAESVAAAAGTAVLGDVIDTGGDGRDGSSEDLWLVIQTDTEIITGGAAGTLQFFLVSDSLATLGGGVVANCTQHFATEAFVTDGTDANDPEMKAGAYIARVQLPKGTYERYLGILRTIATTTITQGAVNAFLTRNPVDYVSMPENVPAPE